MAADFNICLDVARYGVEKSAKILKTAIEDFVYAPDPVAPDEVQTQS